MLSFRKPHYYTGLLVHCKCGFHLEINKVFIYPLLLLWSTIHLHFAPQTRKKKMVCAQPPRLRMTLVTVSEFLRLGGSSACGNLRNHNLHNSKEGEYQKSVRRKDECDPGSRSHSACCFLSAATSSRWLWRVSLSAASCTELPTLSFQHHTNCQRKKRTAKLLGPSCGAAVWRPLAMSGGSPGGGTSCARWYRRI